MRASWFGIQWASAEGMMLKRGPKDWIITEPSTVGIEFGIVWGPLRRPWAFGSGNPWLDKDAAKFILRLPFFIFPWFHVWWWRSRRLEHFRDASGRFKKPHPARLYAGCKLFRADDNQDEDVWRDPKKDPPGWYVTPSASFRRG